MKRIAGLVMATTAFLILTPNTFADEAIMEIRPGNQKIELFEAPGGRKIGTAKSSILLQRGVSQKANGYVRVVGFGRTVWVREDTVFLGESAGFSSSQGRNFSGKGTQGVNWLD